MIKKILILSAAFLMLSSSVPHGALGIGQMTKPIVISSILRGETTEVKLTLYNSEKEETVYKLSAEGDIKNWTYFYSMDDSKNAINDIKIPAKSKINAIAKFNIPQDSPNGKYIGEVAIISTPKSTEGGKVNVSVGSRIGRSVSITVSDEENVKLSATIIPISYDLIKNEPLKIRVIYDNQGNVSVSPQIQLKIKKGNQIVSNTIYPYPESESNVKPLARHEIPVVEVPTTNFTRGLYTAETILTQNGKQVFYHSFNFSMDMFEESAGGYDNNGIVKGVFDSAGIQINWIVIFGATSLIIALLVKSRSFKKKKDEQDNHNLIQEKIENNEKKYKFYI